MAIDIIARGLATSLLGSDGKLASDKLPTMAAVPEGTTFYPVGAITDASLLEGKTADEILLMMLYGIVNPVLTAPSVSIVLDEEITTLTAGRATEVSGELVFDRGSISPAYGTLGYRAGNATSYIVNDVVYESPRFTFTFTPVVGDNIISAAVVYAEGEQPLNSIGQAYDSALPAGTIAASLIIKGVAPVYTLDGEDIEFVAFEDEQGSGYEITVPMESLAGDKQAFAVSSEVEVIGIKQFNVLSQQWEWLGGSAEASLTYFDTTTISGDSLGESEDYVLYTHNDLPTGERELRIYVAEQGGA